MTILLNLTPHVITIHGTSGAITLQPSGIIPRLAVTRQALAPVSALRDGDLLEVPVARPTLGAITDMPSPTTGTILVVSALVAEAAKRPDVMSPGELVRDAAGVITGCRGLCSYV